MSAWVERAQEETDSHMAGWMVTVSIIKDEDQIGHEKIAEFRHKRPFRQRVLFVQAPSMTDPERHALQRTDRPDWAFLELSPHGLSQ
ncbi:MAG TPA: hypothetical protein VMT72_02395 [Pseudolabrys sp.]|nr:hypothetical protein [Pseudolabrys sp.]